VPYGTALSADQLNATASVEGAFVYIPGPGNVLTAGTQTLSTIFTPADIEDYNMARAAVSLVVEGFPDMDSTEQETADEEPEDNSQALQAEEMEEQKSGIESKTPPEGAPPAAGTQASFPSADAADLADTKRGASQSSRPPVPQGRTETRVYKGATYVKGADGQWHLQQK
jgi:hypothetical protein